MRLLLAALMTFAPLGLAGCERPAGPAAVSVSDATINLPAVRGRPASGYFELQPTTDQGALTSVTSPQAERIEMHQTVQSGGMSAMRAMERVVIEDGKPISFTPGGRHLMLFGLDPALTPGKEMELTFHFEKGEPVKTMATLQAPGGGHGEH